MCADMASAGLAQILPETARLLTFNFEALFILPQLPPSVRPGRRGITGQAIRPTKGGSLRLSK